MKIDYRFVYSICGAIWPSLLFCAPEINTPSGKIVGKFVYHNRMKVMTFQSIPYAKPPIGENRFKKTVPVEPWKEPLIADHLPPACIQDLSPFIKDQSPDCLYLNIWAPISAAPFNKKAVMFWIHGGAFSLGSSQLDETDGRVLAALGDVIVVTTNYRLSTEGFLYSGTEDAPGNMGLYDMLAALKWVHSNIECFGGDKHNITIFGQSAGAIAAGMFVVSPLTRGLFRRVIMESGAPSNSEADDNDVDTRLSQQVAEAVGCASEKTTLQNSPKEVVSCLRGKDALLLAQTVKNITGKIVGLFPRYGDEFLPKNARLSMIEGDFQNVDLLIGNNLDEGTNMITNPFPRVFGFFGEKDPEINKTFGEYIIRQNFKDFADPDAVVQHYLGDLSEDDYDAVLNQVAKASGDYARVCPLVYFAEEVAAKKNPVYYYQFTHRPSVSKWATWMGVTHNDEIPFVFGHPLRYPSNYTQMELILSRKMISIWTTFAKTGNQPLRPWPLYSKPTHYYRTLNTIAKNAFGIGPHLEACNFYRRFFGF